MAKLDMKNVAGQKAGAIHLHDSVFAAEVSEHLLWETVKWQLAARRRGTHNTKLRGEVSGTTKKPFKQKGTGRARAGSMRSAQWVGGGTIFGPRPRDYSHPMPRKARRKALTSAISLRAAEGKLVIVEELNIIDGKTRSVAKALAALGITGKSLIVESAANAGLVRGARNLARSKWIAPEGLNVYDILNHEHLVMSSEGARAVEERLRL